MMNAGAELENFSIVLCTEDAKGKQGVCEEVRGCLTRDLPKILQHAEDYAREVAAADPGQVFRVLVAVNVGEDEEGMPILHWEGELYLQPGRLIFFPSLSQLN